MANVKLEHGAIYKDERFFAAFPSIVRQPDGELLVAFRRAPERRWFGGGCTHSDPNAYLVLVRSMDGGRTWTSEPELICAHPMGGSQDPCMTRLSDGTLWCSSYLWILEQAATAHGKLIDHTGWRFTSGGGYLMRSRDEGRTWEGPIAPPPVPGDTALDAMGRPRPACNRGNILEARDGSLYRAVVRRDAAASASGERQTSVHLVASSDRGETWDYRCPIAAEREMGFNETFLHETDAGDLVAFLRTHRGGDRAPSALARSRDGGRSFEPWQSMGFAGHPHTATRLADGRVLLAYGYRRPPYGIRARILDAECTAPGEAEEIVLREDGGTADLGYPWAITMPDGRVLVVYYFNRAGEAGPTESKGAVPPAPDAKDRGITASGGYRYIAATWMRFK